MLLLTRVVPREYNTLVPSVYAGGGSFFMCASGDSLINQGVGTTQNPKYMLSKWFLLQYDE
ncbi:hypothetical protein Back11_26830 [Paenibacillus baekrokdamisoli]|uniref:Uncharacterized protein n=1 Tax=Paenibacillus baekrokdamisoli TaxID=1712516 RepID=A0A3G9JBS7_9BACL|nr:hypothetical protein Back11_26830 [Paenibacillus baekrokdamisoli]